MAKIILSEDIVEALDRISSTYNKYLLSGKAICESMRINRVIYIGTDTTRMMQKNFEEFKKSLENGTNPLLTYEDGKATEAENALIDGINTFGKPLNILLKNCNN
jgi:hypothetical protein